MFVAFVCSTFCTKHPLSYILLLLILFHITQKKNNKRKASDITPALDDEIPKLSDDEIDSIWEEALIITGPVWSIGPIDI